MPTMWLLVLSVFLAAECGSCLTYVATIDMEGVMGYVTFVPDGNNMNVSVSINSNTNYSYKIAEFPAVFGQQDAAQQVCSNLGAVLFAFSGASNGATTVVPAVNENSIFNRGLLLTNGTQVICATVLPVGEETQTWRAKFIGPVVGDVWIRKRPSLSGLLVCTNLAYATGKANPTETTLVSLMQYSTGPNQLATQSDCSALSGASQLVQALSIGNSVSASGKRQCVFASNLQTVQPYVAIVVSSTTEACTNVQMIASKTVTTRFSWDDVVGYVTITQASPFDVTTSSVQLSGLNAAFLPASYHIHKFPVPQRTSSSDDRCSSANVAGHFNPYNAVTGLINQTSDLYEIGDLSGKYGTIDTTSYNKTFTDWNLPMFGPNSVIGRSIVIHRSGGARWVCASIGYPTATRIAVVNFRAPAYGTMYFRQSINDPNGDTSVFGELANINAVMTQSHNYHVHVYPIGTDCASAGPHYNPTQIPTSGNYSALCSSSDPFRCELGDLSGRLGTLDMSTTLQDNAGKFFFTDSNLPLHGIFSVIGRSIVIHDSDSAAPRYACGNITNLWELVVQSGATWNGSNRGSVTGAITLTQASEYDTTSVQGTVSGLANTAQTYGIYELPIQTSAVGVSQCQTLGNLFNPFGVSIPVTNQTFDKYAVGDLSGKYSTLSNQQSITLNKLDDNLPTGVAVGIAGRSIIIHSSSQPWKCSSIDLTPGDTTGHVISAQVLFTSLFVGYLTMRQVVYEDGSASPTTLEVSLIPVSTVTSPKHNWHVHIDPVLSEEECSIAKGHYNPYNANVSASSYGQCLSTNPLACEVGDLSKKHAQYTVQGSSGRRLFIDADLPLHTSKTVLGRSIVFHASNGGAPRVTCANILPTTQVYTLQFESNVQYDYYRFTAAVASALGIKRMRVVVLHNVDIPVIMSGCSSVMVHIAGSVDIGTINALIDGTASGLSPYKPTAKCVSETGANVLGVSSGAAARICAWWIIVGCCVLSFFTKQF